MVTDSDECNLIAWGRVTKKIGSRDCIAIDLGESQSIAGLCLDHFFAASVATCAGRRDSNFCVRT